MKKITLENYKSDKLYPAIVRAVAEITEHENVVTPVAVLMKMQRLTNSQYEDWRFGRIAYLERVIQGNLSQASRILRILRMHAHDLNLVPSHTAYHKWGKGKNRILLRFSKTGDRNIEAAYSQHFLVPQRKQRSGKDRTGRDSLDSPEVQSINSS